MSQAVCDPRLLPGFDQRLRLGLVGVHYQIPALARLAHIVRAQRKAYPLGRTAPAIQAQVTPPSAIVVPNVMVRPVFTVRQFNKFVLHSKALSMTHPALQSNLYDMHSSEISNFESEANS